MKQKMLDIEKMPGYEYRPGFKGIKSVTEGKVFMQEFPAGIYPSCYRHGAICCVAIRQDGKLWRCKEENCEEGCFIPKRISFINKVKLFFSDLFRNKFRVV